VVENALAIPMNLALGVALPEFIGETSMPTIAHHHDFTGSASASTATAWASTWTRLSHCGYPRCAT
jgi:hypothetical protein